MSKALSNPLAVALAAAKKLPATTGATADARRRLARVTIVADVSGSMAEPAGERRKIDVLAAAIAEARPDMPEQETIAFATTARVLGPAERLPDPAGGTAMHLGLAEAARRDGKRVLVISDGMPDDRRQALAEADRLASAGATIDVLYVGPETDASAIAFMRSLVRRGSMRVHDIVRLHEPRRLAAQIRLALPGPA